MIELHELSAADVEIAAAARARPRRVRRASPWPTTRSRSWPTRSGGDARTALAALELACDTAAGGGVTLANAEDALQRRDPPLRQAPATSHYDTISAWIKATRGSDPDASLYYLAVMLEGGEDPRFIARRMVILASEDVGNADPQALAVAVAAADAVEHVGLPEAQFPLAQAAIYLSLAPKSDAAKRAIGAARGHVRDHGARRRPVPARQLLPGAAALGRGRATTTRTRFPATSRRRSCCPTRVAGAALLRRPTTPRPRWRSAWRRSAERAGRD